MNLKISAASGSFFAWVLRGPLQDPADFSQQLVDARKRKTLAGALFDPSARFLYAAKAYESQLVKEVLAVCQRSGCRCAPPLVLTLEQRFGASYQRPRKTDPLAPV